MKNELETVIVEQTGKLSPAKMGWLANLITEYAKEHPESLAEFEKLKGHENNGGLDF